jgi:hypothetical protein
VSGRWHPKMPRPKLFSTALEWPRRIEIQLSRIRHRAPGFPQGLRESGLRQRLLGAIGQRAAEASATVSAVMLTMRRTVAEGVRMCTGWAAPSSTGPIAMPPPAAVLSRL